MINSKVIALAVIGLPILIIVGGSPLYLSQPIQFAYSSPVEEKPSNDEVQPDEPTEAGEPKVDEPVPEPEPEPIPESSDEVGRGGS